MAHKHYICVVCGAQVYGDTRGSEFQDIIRKHIVRNVTLTPNERLAWEGNLCSRACYDSLNKPSYVKVLVAPDATWHRCSDRDDTVGVVNAPSDDVSPMWFPDYLDDEALDVAVHELVDALPTSIRFSVREDG